MPLPPKPGPPAWSPARPAAAPRQPEHPAATHRPAGSSRQAAGASYQQPYHTSNPTPKGISRWRQLGTCRATCMPKLCTAGFSLFHSIDARRNRVDAPMATTAPAAITLSLSLACRKVPLGCAAPPPPPPTTGRREMIKGLPAFRARSICRRTAAPNIHKLQGGMSSAWSNMHSQ